MSTAAIGPKRDLTPPNRWTTFGVEDEVILSDD